LVGPGRLHDNVVALNTGVMCFLVPLTLTRGVCLFVQLKELIGIKESDTGLSQPSMWDLNSDKQMQQEERALQVARCTKIIDPGSDDAKYVINVKQIAKFVVGLGEKVAPTDVEEGMRVGVDREKYSIQLPLPPKIDPSVSLMQVEDKPDVT